MATCSLSNSFEYTIHFTATEYKKHQRLLYIGSLMSQFLTQSYFCQDREQETRLSYEEALQDIIQFIQAGKRYSTSWDKLAIALQPTYNKVTQEKSRKS